MASKMNFHSRSNRQTGFDSTSLGEKTMGMRLGYDQTLDPRILAVNSVLPQKKAKNGPKNHHHHHSKDIQKHTFHLHHLCFLLIKQLGNVSYQIPKSPTSARHLSFPTKIHQLRSWRRSVAHPTMAPWSSTHIYVSWKISFLNQYMIICLYINAWY